MCFVAAAPASVCGDLLLITDSFLLLFNTLVNNAHLVNLSASARLRWLFTSTSDSQQILFTGDQSGISNTDMQVFIVSSVVFLWLQFIY